MGEASHAEGVGAPYLTVPITTHLSGIEFDTGEYIFPIGTVLEYEGNYAYVAMYSTPDGHKNYITLSNRILPDGASGTFNVSVHKSLAGARASHAEGGMTIAFGEYSHSEGYATKAVFPYQHV
jgi:hypothetical protein